MLELFVTLYEGQKLTGSQFWMIDDIVYDGSLYIYGWCFITGLLIR